MENFKQLITTLIDIITKFYSCSLNSIWNGLGITEISFFRFVQLIFFTIFIVLNIWLIYNEYLKKRSKIKDQSDLKYLQSGSTSNLVPQLKKVTTYFLGGLGALSGYITIKNKYRNNKEAEYQNLLAISQAEIKKIGDKSVMTNMYSRMNIDRIDRTFKEVQTVRKERSKLQKEIDEDMEKYRQTGDKTFESQASAKITRDRSFERVESRTTKELEKDIENGTKFSNEINKETDEEKILAKINEDIKKSSMLGVDLENLLKEL
jgi:hypothetical protein